MQELARKVAKLIAVLFALYLLTLLVFLVDTLRFLNRTSNLAGDIQNNLPISNQVSDYSLEMQRYSSALNSILLNLPTAIIGESKSIASIGRTIGSAGRALEKVSPLLDREVENLKLSDTELLARDAKILKSASTDISQAFSQFASIRFSGLLSPFNDRLAEFQRKVARYEEVFSRTSPLLPILPDLLGNYGKRSYFVAMQNSAQARGTGGLLGTFAILSVDKGKLSLDYVAPNTALETFSDIPIEVPDEYRDLYLDYAKTWNGSNNSPHFPYAAQIWAETWKRMTGQEVDGVISIDTFMLRALLAASGPVDVDGLVLDSTNVIEELLSNAYVRFESDPGKRKNYLADVAKVVATRFISGEYSKATLLRETVDPILENRILVYSPYSREARHIALTPLSGILSNAPNNEYRLMLLNIAGNKLDYYIARELSVMSEQCSPIRTTRVDFKITNTADPNKPLPAYVNALRAQGFPQGDRNTQFAGVFLYGPTGAKITGVVDNDTGKTYGWLYTERNRPLYSVQFMIPAGTSKNFTVFFEGGVGPLTSVLQPLVIPQKTQLTDNCN